MGTGAVTVVEDSSLVEVRCYTCGIKTDHMVNGKEPARENTIEGHKQDHPQHDVWQRQTTISYAEFAKPAAEAADDE